VSGRQRIKPRAARGDKPSAFRIAAAGRRWATARAIAALLSAGQHPGRAMLELLRWELDQDPVRPAVAAKGWRNRVLASLAREDVEQLARKLRQQGVSNAVEQARNKLAAKYSHASGEALNRWVRRARSGPGQKRG
jgi:hypothetical protein